MPTARLLDHTGQFWKLVFAFAIGMLSGLGVLLRGTLDVWVSPEASLRVLFFATASGMVAWGMLFFGIHCPGCRTNLFWQAIRTQGADWLIWLLAVKSCPECAFGAALGEATAPHPPVIGAAVRAEHRVSNPDR